MLKKIMKDVVLWGTLLWAFGYILGIILFMAVPTSLIGWIVTPVGVLLTIWVLFKKIENGNMSYYFLIGLGWVLIAILLDYFLLVKLFKPADGYYKLDVYLYYVLTFVLPSFVGFLKSRQK